MNTAFIMLGSNFNPEKHIELAKEKISELYEIESVSSEIATKPHGKNYKSDFRNQAIKLLSDDILDDTRSTMKQIEKDLGRLPDSKKTGIIPIDIDIIIWNDQTIHKDYERFEFVRKCINEIA